MLKISESLHSAITEILAESNAADVIQPPGATHVHWFYGDPHYYKLVQTPHVNSVSGENQFNTTWHHFDHRTQKWGEAEERINSAKFKKLTK